MKLASAITVCALVLIAGCSPDESCPAPEGLPLVLENYQPSIPAELTELYEAENVTMAEAVIARIHAGAEAGDPASQTALGRLLYLGDFLEADKARAVSLLEEAADNKNSYAAWTLAYATYDPQAPEASNAWLKQAADLGDDRSAFLYFMRQFLNLRAASKQSGGNPDILWTYLERAADAGLPDAMRVRGYLNYLGNETPEKRSKGLTEYCAAMKSSGAPVPKGLEPLRAWSEVVPAGMEPLKDEKQRKIIIKGMRTTLEDLAETGWAYPAWILAKFSDDIPILTVGVDKNDLSTSAKAYALKAARAEYPPAMASVDRNIEMSSTWPDERSMIFKAAKLGSVGLGLCRVLVKVPGRQAC